MTRAATPGSERQLRADARRNRERVLAAARAAFAEQGLEAGMSDIAERAGVGVGTLYRHFPTKEALVEALIRDHLARIGAEARAALEEDDPWEAFVRLLHYLAEQKAEDQCLTEVFEGRGSFPPDVVELGHQAFDAMSRLMRRAQLAGALRPDLAPGDLPVLLSALSCAVWMHGERGAELGERYLAIVIDGLRAPGTTPLPKRALSKRELLTLFQSPGEPLPPRRRRALS